MLDDGLNGRKVQNLARASLKGGATVKGIKPSTKSFKIGDSTSKSTGAQISPDKNLNRRPSFYD